MIKLIVGLAVSLVSSVDVSSCIEPVEGFFHVRYPEYQTTQEVTLYVLLVVVITK